MCVLIETAHEQKKETKANGKVSAWFSDDPLKNKPMGGAYSPTVRLCGGFLII